MNAGVEGTQRLESFLNPKSIILFGASEDETKLRGRITRLIVENGYAGALHFINPSKREIAGRPCHAALSDLAGSFDLAIIVVPAAQVMPALEQCAGRVANALIMSSGFAEEGGAQSDVQAQIADLASTSGMRVCGPNAEGFHNELASLSATFSPAVEIEPDEVFTVSNARIGVIAQSGGVGFALYHRGRHLGLSYSSVVTTGNEVDLTAADFLAYMAADPDTAVILLFLETVRDGPGFVRALEAAAEAGKPVIAVKVGRSAAGSRATVSHTGSIAGWDAAYDAVFAHHGVTVAEDLGRALAIAAGFVTNPLPMGNRAAVVTVSGGAGALAADRLGAMDFDLPELSAELRAAVAALIPSYGSTTNPIDVTGQATRTGAPLRTIELLSEGDEVDVVIMASTMSNRTRPPVDVDGLRALLAKRLKPVFFFTYTLPSSFGLRALAQAGIATYTSVDDMAASIAAMLRYREFQDVRAPAVPVEPGEPLRLPPGVLVEHAGKDLLAARGFPFGRRALVTEVAEVATLSSDMFPVAAKIQSSDIPHKTEAGGVRLSIPNACELAAACTKILQAAADHKPEAKIDGILIEPMARSGVEMIVGITRDATFGPIVTIGAGGTAAELVRDVARLPGPLSEAQALSMMRSLKTFPLLDGYRGAQAADQQALARLAAKLSVFVAAHPEVEEAELNPVIVHPRGEGATILDVLLVIGDAIPAAASRR